MTTEATAEFTAFVRGRSRDLTRTAYLLTGDQHLAEDLLQDVLLKVLRRWDRIERREEGLDAYVRTALYREYVSWTRLRRNTEVPTAAPADTGGPGFTDRVELRLGLRAALTRLTRRQRAVIVLRFFEDLSEADTAHLLGCSPGTVKTLTHRALRRLRSLAPDLGERLPPTPLAGPDCTPVEGATR